MVTVTLNDNEKKSVENHRRLFFREVLGKSVPNDDIEQLVHSNVSPHDVRRLKDEGWPIEYIIKVLL